MVCGGFLSPSSGACVSTVHLEFVETWILVFLTLCWYLPSQPASQSGVFSLTITEVRTHDVLPVKSSGCFAVSGWRGAHMVLLSGDFSGRSSSGWLIILSGFSGWSAGGGPVCPPHTPRPPPFLSQGSREVTQLLNPRCCHHCISRLLAWLLLFCLHLWSYPFGGTPVRPSFWFVV